MRIWLDICPTAVMAHVLHFNPPPTSKAALEPPSIFNPIPQFILFLSHFSLIITGLFQHSIRFASCPRPGKVSASLLLQPGFHRQFPVTVYAGQDFLASGPGQGRTDIAPVEERLQALLIQKRFCQICRSDQIFLPVEDL